MVHTFMESGSAMKVRKIISVLYMVGMNFILGEGGWHLSFVPYMNGIGFTCGGAPRDQTWSEAMNYNKALWLHVVKSVGKWPRISKPAAEVHHGMGRKTDMDRVTRKALLIKATPDSREIYFILVRPSCVVIRPSQTCKRHSLLLMWCYQLTEVADIEYGFYSF